MRRPKLLPLPPPVVDLQTRIAQWRTTRTKLGPMPKDLWSEAAQLARQHSVAAIASALRLNYEALKAWVADIPRGRCRVTSGRRPAFVQLDPLPAISPSCSTVEVMSPGGAKMTIRLPASTVLDAVALLNAFAVLSRRR